MPLQENTIQSKTLHALQASLGPDINLALWLVDALDVKSSTAYRIIKWREQPQPRAKLSTHQDYSSTLANIVRGRPRS